MTVPTFFNKKEAEIVTDLVRIQVDMLEECGENAEDMFKIAGEVAINYRLSKESCDEIVRLVAMELEMYVDNAKCEENALDYISKLSSILVKVC